MGLLDIIKTAAREAVAPQSEPSQFVRTYTNASRFKGFRRTNVTVYGDMQNANDNCLALLDGKDTLDCIGREITLTGFTYEDGNNKAVRVAVDGKHIGVVWVRENDPVHAAIYDGTITDVFVRISTQNVIGKGTLEVRGHVLLFVKMPV